MAHSWELTSIHDYSQKWHCHKCGCYITMRGARPPEPETPVLQHQLGFWMASPFESVDAHFTCEEAQILPVQES